MLDQPDEGTAESLAQKKYSVKGVPASRTQSTLYVKDLYTFFFFLLFRHLEESSQARGQIVSVAAGLHNNHSKSGSLTH